MKQVLLLLFLYSLGFSARVALLVGNKYGGSYQPLKYVHNDMRGVQRVLSQFCDFDESNITLCLNKSPRYLKSLLDSMSTILSSEDDIFIFYYSGHADNLSLLMGKERYYLSELKSQLKKLPTQIRILIFDACQSGSFTRFKGGTLEEPFLYKPENKIEGQIVLYSSSANEFSQESDMYKNSIFTFHFINALRGCADVSSDQKVTLYEAYQYSYSRTVSSTIHSTGGVQHPGYQFRIQGEGNIVLADMSSCTQGIVLDQDLEETVIVMNSRNELVADLSKKKGQHIFIAVNPGTYDIYNNKKGSAQKTKIQVKDTTITVIKTAMFRNIRSIPVLSKGARRPNTLCGVSMQGGMIDFDFSSLQSQCNAMYSAYAMYGMRPSIALPKGLPSGGLGFEMHFPNNLQFLLNGGYVRFAHKTSYIGSKTSPADTSAYPVTLSIADSLSCLTLQTYLGYRFDTKVLNFFSIRLGFDWIFLKFALASEFVDYFFMTKSSTHYVDKGIFPVPIIGATFQYFFQGPFSVGAHLNYRYQNSFGKISFIKNTNTGTNNGLKYNFSGINFSLVVTYFLNKY